MPEAFAARQEGERPRQTGCLAQLENGQPLQRPSVGTQAKQQPPQGSVPLQVASTRPLAVLSFFDGVATVLVALKCMGAKAAAGPLRAPS